MILDTVKVEERAIKLTRVAALSEKTQQRLLRLGVDPSDLGAVLRALRDSGIPTDPGGLIETVFKPRLDKPTPFLPGRYGDGSYPVFYAAMDSSTATSEKAFYVAEEAMRLGRPLFFQLFSCDYAGDTANLVGLETDYPQLVEDKATGWPFCQAIGSRARQQGIDGLQAPSARHTGGICTPIFFEQALCNAQIVGTVTFSPKAGDVTVKIELQQ